MLFSWLLNILSIHEVPFFYTLVLLRSVIFFGNNELNMSIGKRSLRSFCSELYLDIGFFLIILNDFIPDSSNETEIYL